MLRLAMPSADRATSVCVVLGFLVVGIVLALRGPDGIVGAKPASESLGAAIATQPTERSYSVALFPYQSDHRVEVIDNRTAARVALIPIAGHSPDALQRPAFNQLLVTDTPEDGSGSRLTVYALGADFAAIYSTTLPRMLQYGLYSRTLTLSMNERYLYYIAFDHHWELSQCQVGARGSSAECDIFQIGVFDLQDRVLVGISPPMPAACGAPIVLPVGVDGAIAACRKSGDVQIVSSAASVTEHDTFESQLQYYSDAGRSRERMAVLGAFRQANGELGVLEEDGVYFARTPSGGIISGRFLPPGRAMMPLNSVFTQPDGTLLVGSHLGTPESALSGANIFSPETLTVRSATVFDDAQSLAPSVGEGLQVLMSGGARTFIDEATSQPGVPVPSNWVSSENREWFLVP